jgi:uncharacterized protein with FMN-binding domain
MPKRASLALLVTGIALALLLNFKTPTAPVAAPIGGSTIANAGSAASTTTAPGAAAAATDPAGSSTTATTAAATSAAAASTSSATKSGTYTGSVVQTQYGAIQVQLTVANGTITNVQALKYPSNNPHSSSINRYALPTLIQEALQTQSAQINAVSGATYTSQGFVQSLQSALSQAGV